MSCSIVRVGLVTSCLLGMALLVGCQGESAKKPASPTKDATSGAKSDQSASRHAAEGQRCRCNAGGRSGRGGGGREIRECRTQCPGECR